MKVESRVAFGAELTELVRRRLATDPALAPYLQVWLRVNGSVDKLESASTRPGSCAADLGRPFRSGALLRARPPIAFAGLPTSGGGRRRDPSAIRNARRASRSSDRLDYRCGALTRAFLDRRRRRRASWPPIDELVRDGDDLRLRRATPTRRPPGRGPAVRPPHRAGGRAPPAGHRRWRSGSCRSSTRGWPPASARPASTTSTTCCRWSPTRCAARAARRWSRRCARRYRLALIDEFQDTDPVQWEIFRRVFHDSARRAPARTSSVIRSRRSTGSAAPTSRPTRRPAPRSRRRRQRRRLVRNFRSTPAVIDAYNAILDQRRRPALLQRRHPLRRRPWSPAATIGRRRDAAVPPRRSCSCGSPPTEETTRAADAPGARRAGARDRATRRRAAGDARRPAARGRSSCSRGRAASRRRSRSALARRRRAARALQPGGPVRDRRGPPCARPAARDRGSARPAPRGCGACSPPSSGCRWASCRPRRRRTGTRCVDRLFDWHAIAEAHDLARLYPRILDESGVVRRELFGGRRARGGSPTICTCSTCSRRRGARVPPARRGGAPAVGAGGRASSSPRPRKGTCSASRATATPCRS